MSGVSLQRSWHLWSTFSLLFHFHDKPTESTWHNDLSGVCLGFGLPLWYKSARTWRPIRQLEATLEERVSFSAANHIHSAASHCFSLRTWQPQTQAWIKRQGFGHISPNNLSPAALVDDRYGLSCDVFFCFCFCFRVSEFLHSF